jgi:hypothetical protein
MHLLAGFDVGVFRTTAVILSDFDMFCGSWKYHTSIPAPDAVACQPSE